MRSFVKDELFSVDWLPADISLIGRIKDNLIIQDLEYLLDQIKIIINNEDIL